MPRRRQRPGWLWSEPTSGSKGRIGSVDAASAGPDTPVSSAGKPPGSLWTPRTSSLLVLSGLFAAQVAGIFSAPITRHRLALWLMLIAAGLLFVLQLCVGWRGAANWSPRRRLWVMVAMGTLTYLPLAALGAQWPGMAGFLAGSILILRPARSSWGLFGGVMATVFAAALGLGVGVRDAAYLLIASLSIGVTVFALYQLRLALMRAHGASTQLSQLTSVRERERFSRDLHDILGYSLSAITLKAELTKKLVGNEPTQAQDELAELVELARQAAADVRMIASGYCSISLAREAASAASLLSAACITPRVAIDCGALDDKVDAVLATVLREAVTNVLRHSAARNCAIEANQDDRLVTLTVTNDGVPRSVMSGTGGHGLRNLAWRLEAIGGELSTAGSGDDQFSLLATVPAHEEPVPVAGRNNRASVDHAGHELGGPYCLRGGKSALSWRNIGWLRLKVGQGEQNRQVRRAPGTQFDPGGDDAVGADRHRAGPANKQRPAGPRLGVRVVRYCYRTEEPRPLGHSRQLK
jgi:two-component system, NarL family, sensor histidine kinase DesK